MTSRTNLETSKQKKNYSNKIGSVFEVTDTVEIVNSEHSYSSNQRCKGSNGDSNKGKRQKRMESTMRNTQKKTFREKNYGSALDASAAIRTHSFKFRRSFKMDRMA